MKKEDKFFYVDLVEKLKGNKFLSDNNFEVTQFADQVIIKKASTKTYYKLSMHINTIFGFKKKYLIMLNSNTLVKKGDYFVYFLDDDFNNKIFKQERFPNGGGERWIDHFPTNLFNNLILLIKFTRNKKGLSKVEFQELFELTNFGNPDELEYPITKI